MSAVRISFAALAVIAAGVAGGCSKGPPPSVPAPQPESPYTSKKPDRPATTVDQVKRYAWYELPDGILVTQGSAQAAKGFPTAEDPHAVLGSFKVPAAVTDAQEGLRLALEAAAQHGGNGLVFHPEDPRLALVLYVSAADPGYPTPAALFEALEKTGVPREFKPGKEVTRSLEQWKPVDLSLRRNQCYGLGWVFTGNVQVDLRSLFRGWFVESKRPSEERPIRKQHFFRPDKEGRVGRAHFQHVGCVRQDAVVSLTLTPHVPNDTGPGKRKLTSDVASWASVHEKPSDMGLGKGEIVLRPYVFSVSETTRQQACAQCMTGIDEYGSDCLQRFHLTHSICK